MQLVHTWLDWQHTKHKRGNFHTRHTDDWYSFYARTYEQVATAIW